MLKWLFLSQEKYTFLAKSAGVVRIIGKTTNATLVEHLAVKEMRHVLRYASID